MVSAPKVILAPLGVTPIIKVVGDSCNLRCSYCFYNTRDQSELHVMSDDLLERLIVEYTALPLRQHRFIWHGGEPLLAGLAFFQKAVGLQRKCLRDGQRIINDIQTNATLIDDSWASFFKANNFRVGVSLDGDRESHNRFRKDCGGKGSFDRVMRGIGFLKSHRVSHGFLQTLTKGNLARAREDFDFFVDTLGTRSWGVNPYLDIDGVNKAMLGQNITNGELVGFLRRYIEFWLTRDDPSLRIREIENFLAGVLGKRASNCSFSGSCAGYFCLEWDGRVYPCDRLSGRDDLLLGDLSKQPLLNILNGPARLRYVTMVETSHSDCAACGWRNACHNGCPHHRVGGVGGKYYYCEARREIFSYLEERVDEYKKHLSR